MDDNSFVEAINKCIAKEKVYLKGHKQQILKVFTSRDESGFVVKFKSGYVSTKDKSDFVDTNKEEIVNKSNNKNKG